MPGSAWTHRSCTPRTRHGRIPLAKVLVPERRGAVAAWLKDAAARVDLSRDVPGYDLAGFFKRNSDAIKAETLTVLKGLVQ